MSFVLAHAAHWLSAFVYAGPVLIVGLLFLVASHRRRRDEAAGRLGSEGEEGGP